MKNCKSCQNEINSEFVFCPLCGVRADGNKECPKCKTLSAEQNKFCPSCGYNFGAFAKQEQKSEVAVKPQPADKKARRSFKQVLTSEKNGANFILNCAALVFAVATLFILAFAPLTKIKLDFSNMPVQFKGSSKIELRINYIDTTSAVTKSLFYTKKDWQANRTAEKFTSEIGLLQAKFQLGYAVDLRPSQRSMNRLNFAELSVISSALTDEGIKTPSVFWMLAIWSTITAVMILDIILIIFLTIRITKLDFKKYRSKLLAPLGILLFSMVFIFGHTSGEYNFGFATGKEVALSTAVILPIVFLSVLSFVFLLFDIIEKGFKKFGRYAFSLVGAVLALFLGLAGRGGIVKIRSEVNQRGYSTSLAPSDIISVLDNVAEYIRFPHAAASDEYGAEKVISEFSANVEAADELSPDLAKALHRDFTVSLLSCYEFTLSEIDALVMFSITSLLFILSGVLPALLLIFALRRMTADDENIKKPLVLSIIAVGLYLALFVLDIVSVSMLNNAFDSTIILRSNNIIGQPTIDIRAAITFNAVISFVLSMGVFGLYLVKSIIYKARAPKIQSEIAPQEN